eukprot:TRINITY_DN565_c1_g2_i1.p1 TRINITY_DN565_c1_g2~~TRINITY_DN565_c1_g2_i1.p1  ORF type:complete len:342 (-),score=58.32 TRINITY_DN565_c1_g2_i1:847-1872(-)
MSAPRLAATVLALAPRVRKPTSAFAEDYQVLMVKRTMKARFMPGAHVFPGGVEEKIDHASEKWTRLFQQRKYAASFDDSNNGGSGDEGSSDAQKLSMALKLCGIRETFEETSVLLSHPPITQKLPEVSRYLGTKVSRDPDLFLALFENGMSSPALVPDVNRLIPWARWITPTAEKYRYDTWFYVAPLETLPQAVQDDGEISQYDWFSPSEAISMAEQGVISLPPPTWFMLRQLLLFPTLSDVTQCATRDMRPIQPRMKMTDDGLNIILPGDTEWSDESPSIITAPSSHNGDTSQNRIVVRPGGRYNLLQSSWVEDLPVTSGVRAKADHMHDGTTSRGTAKL